MTVQETNLQAIPGLENKDTDLAHVLLTLHQLKCEELERIKRAMFQYMFIMIERRTYMNLNFKTLRLNKDNSQVEAKSAQYALPKSFWETYSSFANTNGGQIILGVSEDKDTKELSVTGIDNPDAAEKQFWDTINNPQKVSCNILSNNDFNTITTEDGKTVFIIHVPRAMLELRPVYINNDIINGSFKRNHEGDYHMTKEEVSKMLRDACPYSYDQKVYDELPLSVLSDDTITKFRRYHEGHKENHPWSKLPKEQYLLMIGAAAFSESDSVAHPTMAGLLMFGEEHVITRFFPDYFLDYRENLDPGKVRWTDRVQSISGEWSGNVFDFYLLVNNKLVMDLKVPFKLRGMERVDNTPLHDAVREAFINCLSNADYFGRCGIVIRKNIDSIVYENPGSIRVGKEQMMRGGISDARNKTIMKMFNLLGYGEKAGSGIPMIIQAAEEFGLPSPEVSENLEFDRTLFTIYVKPNLNKENEVDFATLKNDGSVMTNPPDNAETVGYNAEAAGYNAEAAGYNAEAAGDNAKTAGDNAETGSGGAETYIVGNPPKSKHVKQNSADLILQTIEGKELSAREISLNINLSLRRTRELLSKLVKSGKVVFYGSNEKRKYLLP